MDVDAVLEAFQDFEKTGKNESCPVLEQFLCHVAKTGQPLIPWCHLKQYFMYKLEEVMDDFQASAPEQRVTHNPNVEYVPFKEMKERILKIVDGYNGIPFTIQRLCELLMDPRRNYTGTDKFLRGLEKNVMVVSSVYSASEKNRTSSVNRMNGVMFPGNSSLYSDSRNVNGPATPRPLTRPKISFSSSLSTNGLPESPVSKEPELNTEEAEEQNISDSSSPESDRSPNGGTKNKHSEDEDEEEEDSDADKQEVKRLKFETKSEEEETPPCREEGSENSSEMLESSEDPCGPDGESGTSRDTTSDHETEPCETEDGSSETEDVRAGTSDDGEPPALSERRTGSDGDNEESGSSSGSTDVSDGDKELPSPSSCSSPDLSTEGAADNSKSTDTAD